MLTFSYDPVIYPGVGHAWLGRGMADDAHDAEKATVQQAWNRWMALLKAL